jgi:transcriptional regulator with XRE-family HTH domain
LHKTYISSVERGDRNISLENIVKLGKALGVSGEYLLKKAGL